MKKESKRGRGEGLLADHVKFYTIVGSWPIGFTPPTTLLGYPALLRPQIPLKEELKGTIFAMV